MIIQDLARNLHLTDDIEGTRHATPTRILAAQRLPEALRTCATVDAIALPTNNSLYDAVAAIAQFGEKHYGSIQETRVAVDIVSCACQLAYGKDTQEQERIFALAMQELGKVPLLQTEHYHMPVPEQ